MKTVPIEGMGRRGCYNWREGNEGIQNWGQGEYELS